MPLTSRVAEPRSRRDQSESSPLDADQLSAIVRAAADLRVLRRATTLARVNATGLFVCAALSFVFAFFSRTALIACVVLLSLGWLELRGARALQRQEPTAGRTLLLSQALTLGAIVLYCAVSIGIALLGEVPSERLLAEHPEVLAWLDEAGEIDPEQALSMLDRSYRFASIGFYVLIAVVSGLYQGFCAMTYRRAGDALTHYRTRTAPWMRELLSKVIE